MRSRRKKECTNCKEPIESLFVFQGVIVCERCHKITNRCVQKAQAELKMLFLTYTDMLRQALVEGKMNFPVLPGSTRMPRGEMEAALHKAASKIGGFDGEGQTAEGNRALHLVRDPEIDPGGEVLGGGGAKPVPGRG